jgi:polar amino acid transport system substrate-binding protein
MSPNSSSKITPSAAARTELIARDTLRVAFPVASALYVLKDPATASLRGVSIEIGKELAARFGVPFEACPYTTVRDLIRATDADEWDLATVVIEQERETVLDFSAPYLEADSTYLVAQESRIRSVPDADVPAIRIGVAERSAFDLFLTRTLRHATLIRYPGVAAAFEGFRSKDNDVVAAPRPVLATALSKIPPARVLDDRFDVARVAIAMRRGRSPDTLTFVNGFIAEITASGWLLQAIERSGIAGIRIAQPRASATRRNF